MGKDLLKKSKNKIQPELTKFLYSKFSLFLFLQQNTFLLLSQLLLHRDDPKCIFLTAFCNSWHYNLSHLWNELWLFSVSTIIKQVWSGHKVRVQFNSNFVNWTFYLIILDTDQSPVWDHKCIENRTSTLKLLSLLPLTLTFPKWTMSKEKKVNERAE